MWTCLAMMTTRNLPRRCAPHLRCYRHVIGQKGVDNDDTPSPAHPSIGKCCFMLPSDVRFGSKDY